MAKRYFRPLFRLGQLVITTNAQNVLAPGAIEQALSRHQTGDWGDLGDDDKHLNDSAVKDGGRILSAYRSATGVKFWIITEADRSSTTILLPEDY